MGIVAWGQEAAPSEREAEAAAERALRKRDWQRAIGSLRECVKGQPLTVQVPPHDPRTDVTLRLLTSILGDLARREAPEAEKLPYWDFWFNGFPFFCQRIDDPDDLAAWRACGRAAAEARWRAAATSGTVPGIEFCRAIEAACRAKATDELLALLARHPHREHADFDRCAFAAYETIAGIPTPEGRETASGLFLSCFPQSPVVAFLLLGDCERAVDDDRLCPLARRALAIRALENAAAGDDAAVPWAALDALHAAAAEWHTTAEDALPWIARARAAEDDFSAGEAPAGAALRALGEWERRFPDHPLRGFARYAAVVGPPRENHMSSVCLQDDLVRQWRKETPEDPALLWLRLLHVKSTSGADGGMADRRDWSRKIGGSA